MKTDGPSPDVVIDVLVRLAEYGYAVEAQADEQRICNAQAAGSTPVDGSPEMSQV